jgi:hypothetical protein
MKLHRVVLDIASQLVRLNSPVCGKIIPHLPMISHIKASFHHVVELKLEDIHVIQEFLNVFLDDLPECHLKGQLSLRLGCSLVPLL